MAIMLINGYEFASITIMWQLTWTRSLIVNLCRVIGVTLWHCGVTDSQQCQELTDQRSRLLSHTYCIMTIKM